MVDESQDPIAAVEHELTVLLRRARAVSAAMAREVHPDLDPPAYGLLVLLLRCGPTRLTDLAARLGTSKGTLSRQLRALARMGLVQHRPDPRDRRAVLLETTDEGRRRFQRARVARTEELRRILQGWPQAEQVEFARLLRRFNEAPR
jgi:DNA-binding MarR family transcriptional regulator